MKYKVLTRFNTIAAAAVLAAVTAITPVSAASVPSATARVNAPGGAILRASASTDAKAVMTLSDNRKLTVTKEVFTSKSKTDRTTRWYRVKAGGKTGYVRTDLVDGISYGKVTAYTTDGINCRAGAGTKMAIKGSLPAGAKVTVLMNSSQRGSSDNWYRIKADGETYYVSAKYIRLGSASSKSDSASKTPLASKSEASRAILANPTNEGSACRIVYTLDESNCSRKFEITGLGKAVTPQGMAYTGSIYAVVFGNTKSQAIVKYSTGGKRLEAIAFPYNMGHPNGMAYNPKTNRYYIFKGNQYKVYTNNPDNDSFGTATTPYQSSGIGYDRVRNVMVASSRTGMRVYSADGKFTHKKLIYRCTHSGTHYVQDCTVYNGIVLHGVSGADKQATNYIDIYRVDDSKYLGSIQLKLGEIESMIVNDKGYLDLLVNTKNKDYIWSTNINVKEISE